MREPLPICLPDARPRTPQAAAIGQDPIEAAQREWTTEWGFDQEDRELEHLLVLRRRQCR